jgi:hypothetical protein
MHQPSCVCELQATARIQDDAYCPLDSQARSGREQLSQVLPLHELHHQVRRAIDGPIVDDPDDVLAGDRASRLRLSQEALHHDRSVSVLLVQELEREVPPDHRMPRFVDAAHSAAGQPPQDVVFAVHYLSDATVPHSIGAIPGMPALTDRAGR